MYSSCKRLKTTKVKQFACPFTNTLHHRFIYMIINHFVYFSKDISIQIIPKDVAQFLGEVFNILYLCMCFCRGVLIPLLFNLKYFSIDFNKPYIIVSLTAFWCMKPDDSVISYKEFHVLCLGQKQTPVSIHTFLSLSLTDGRLMETSPGPTVTSSSPSHSVCLSVYLSHCLSVCVSLSHSLSLSFSLQRWLFD